MHQAWCARCGGRSASSSLMRWGYVMRDDASLDAWCALMRDAMVFVAFFVFLGLKRLVSSWVGHLGYVDLIKTYAFFPSAAFFPNIHALSPQIDCFKCFLSIGCFLSLHRLLWRLLSFCFPPSGTLILMVSPSPAVLVCLVVALLISSLSRFSSFNFNFVSYLFDLFTHGRLCLYDSRFFSFNYSYFLFLLWQQTLKTHKDVYLY